MRNLLITILLLAAPLGATTRYISPTGSDSNGPTCATGTPCKTFNYVINTIPMVAGDTLILKDGTYNTATTGFISLNGKNGTAGSPFTFQAEHERLAYILCDGTTDEPIKIYNSSYISLIGLRVKNRDAYLASPNGGSVIEMSNANHLVFRRLLVEHNNRCYNGAAISGATTSDSLFEENELYYFHRNGLAMGGSNNIFRRNYLNGRSAADLTTGCGSGGTSAGYASSPSTTGDIGVGIYPGSNNIFENNIVENVGGGLDLEALGTTNNNKFYGNIANACQTGLKLTVRGTTLNFMPQNTIVQDTVVIASTSIGIYLRGNKNTTLSQATIIGGSSGGFAADLPTVDHGDSAPSVYLTNVNSSGNTGYGFYSAGQTAWQFNYPNSFGNSGADSPAFSNANIINETTVNPSLGSCYVWVPTGAGIKTTGLSGQDQGANILYETVNGVLTSTKLWNTSTNDFIGCGAIVSGVNDVAGTSCSNVDIRLHIGTTNGCSFPAGYASSSTAGGFWLPTDDFDSYTIGADLNAGAGGTGWGANNWTSGTAAVTIAAAPAGSGGQGGNAAFINADPNFSYTRSFADLSAGLVSWLFRLDSTTLGDSIMFALDETTDARGLITLDTGGIAKLYDFATGTRIALAGTWAANTWNKLTVEFDDAAQPNAFRAKLNAGNFSSWQGSANGGSYSVINRFRMTTLNGSGFAGQLYVDAIQEGNAASVQSTIELVDAGLSSQGFFVGTIKPLAWSSTDLTGNIDLLISRNGGLTYEPIALGVSNTGTYNWTVTGPACSQCRVKVRSSSNSNINDVSLPFRVFGRHLR